MSSFIDRLNNSPITKEIQSAANWWTGELRRLAEDINARLPQKPSNDQSVVYKPSVEASPEKSVNLSTLGDDQENWSLLKEKAKEDKNSSRTLTVFVPESQCLVRSSTYPKVALAELHNVIELELATTTPFSSENSAWTWREGNDGKTDVVIVKREVLDRISSHAEQAGLILKEIRLEASTPKEPPFQAYETPETRRTRLWRKVNIGLAAALASLIIVGYGVSYYQKSSALAELKAEIAAKTSQARELRATLNQQEKQASAAQTLLALKNDRTSVVETWARITRLLPNSAWASELMLNKNGGTIVGFTGNAASLIELLDRDPALKDVTFATAIRIDPLSKAERFDIRFGHEHSAQTLAATGVGQ